MRRAELGLGGAALGNLYDAVAESDADATGAAAWTRGIRLFDTAEIRFSVAGDSREMGIIRLPHRWGDTSNGGQG